MSDRHPAPFFAIALAALVSFAGAPGSSAFAEDQPASWAVTGVAAGDVLHLRDVPSADSKSIARIPANARGLKNLGCLRKDLPLDQWMRMSTEDRALAKTGWCRVAYLGREGWVAWRYLKKDQ